MLVLVIIDFTYLFHKGQRIAEEAAGRFLSPGVLQLDLAVFLWTKQPRFDED